jgi:ABC-type sugar transport system substrate-binding protein
MSRNAPPTRRPARRRAARRWALAAVAAATASALAACGSGAPSGGAGANAGGGGTQDKKVTLISCTNSNPWCAGFNKGIEDGLGAQGVKVTTLVSNFDAAQAAQQFSQALTQRPDLILFYANDPNAAVASYTRAKQAGVPVVVVDTVAGDQAKGLVAGALQPDHAALGKYAAQNIQEGLQRQGVQSGNVIAITGTGTQLTTQVRMAAFREQLATTPQYKLVEVQDGNWDPTVSATIASQMFAKYGATGVQAVYGMADYPAAAIAQAAQQAGLPRYPEAPRGLVITGSNCAPTGVDAIRAGRVYGGATQAPAVEATQFVPYVEQVLTGKSLDNQGVVSVPVDRVTRDNLDKFAQVCTY